MADLIEMVVIQVRKSTTATKRSISQSYQNLERYLKGQVTQLRDGDTIEVNGIAIRLSALDCPERGTRDGERANRLAQQFLTTKAVCELTGAKTYDRLVGYCIVGGQDFGLFMMRNSACKLWEKYDVWDRY